jgi:hypothetical protein
LRSVFNRYINIFTTILRTFFLALLILGLVVAAAATWWGVSNHQRALSSGSAPQSAETAARGSKFLAPVFVSSTRSHRVVYPYSIIPGGVQTPNELEQISESDDVVARHYAGFNFSKASVVEIERPALVYLSYRIHDKVFWTKKRVALRKGEKLITDGKITARTRCGNRVSSTPQNAASAQEPAAESFERPFGDGGSAIDVPIPGDFHSALSSRAQVLGFGTGALGPAMASALYGPYFGGGAPGFSPPPLPLPVGSCGPALPGKPAKGSAQAAASTTNPCTPGTPNPPPGTPPPVTPPAAVPEPGTIVLLVSGLAGLYLRRKK